MIAETVVDRSHLLGTYAHKSDESACNARDVWFAYRQPSWILKGVSVDVPQEGFLTILGPSGAGKTTLVKLLAGLIRPSKGQVRLLGQSTSAGLPQHVRQHVGYIPQQLGLVRGLTVVENVLLGALGRMPGPGPLLSVFPRIEVERCHEFLALLGIEDKAHEKVYRLSGGERQRVAIARTLLQKPKIIFADEFVSDLDLPRAVQVLSAMRELVRCERIAFVINLHEVLLVQELADQVIVVREGSIVHRGHARDVTLSFMREVLG